MAGQGGGGRGGAIRVARRAHLCLAPCKARGDLGEHRPSSWWTLLPMVAPRPLAVAPGDTISLASSVELQPNPIAAPRYTLRGRLTPGTRP